MGCGRAGRRRVDLLRPVGIESLVTDSDLDVVRDPDDLPAPEKILSRVLDRRDPVRLAVRARGDRPVLCRKGLSTDALNKVLDRIEKDPEQDFSWFPDRGCDASGLA